MTNHACLPDGINPLVLSHLSGNNEVLHGGNVDYKTLTLRVKVSKTHINWVYCLIIQRRSQTILILAKYLISNANFIW